MARPGADSGALRLQRERFHEVVLRARRQALDRVPNRRARRSRARLHAAALAPREVDGLERVVLRRIDDEDRTRSGDATRRAARCAADAGSVSKPAPGRLSNGAASFSRAASYGVGFTFTPGSAPMTFIFPRGIVGQRGGGRDDADAHLERQRPAGRVVRALGRAARILPEIRIRLDVEDLARHRRELLIGRDDPRARRKRLGADRHRRRQHRRRARRRTRCGGAAPRPPPDRAAAAG